MKFLKNFFGNAETKKSVVQSSMAVSALRMSAPKTWDYDKIAKEADLQNAIAARCFQMIREACASVDLMVYVGDKEVKDHDFAKLLVSPNPYMGGKQFLEHFYGYYSLVGEAYLERVTIGKRITELHLHNPKNVQLKLDGANFPHSYEVKNNGQVVGKFLIDGKSSKSDLLHLWTFNPLSPWTGKAAAYSAGAAIDAHNLSSRWRNALLNNSAMPSGAMIYNPKNGEPLTDPQYEQLKSEIDHRFMGANNAGRPMILDGGLDWKSIGLNPKDMDTTNLKDADAREIALALGVPPALIGLKGDNTYSNLKEANAAFYRSTVLNIVNRFTDRLTAWLIPLYGENFKVIPNVETIEALAVERQAVWDKVQNADFLTINEKRELVGYDKIADGDDVLIPANLLPLGETDLVEGEAAPKDEE